MTYRETRERIAAYRREIAALRVKMRGNRAGGGEELRVHDTSGQRASVRPVRGQGRSVRYSQYGHIVHALHDVGGRFQRHLRSYRRSGVLRGRSPDPPDVQKRFAAGRGWKFLMVGHAGTTFARDMGYRSENDGYLPGVSVFKRDGARILRVADTGFRPGDDFCALWSKLWRTATSAYGSNATGAGAVGSLASGPLEGQNK